MNTVQRPRIVIAGTHSGVGKTTIVAGLLAALTEQGKAVQAFKVGPDYIDPGFHKIASQRECYNLDTWLVPPHKSIPFFAGRSETADISIIEGVMGLYDGGREGVSSTAQVAKDLNAPVVLVIDCKAMGESAAAIAKGFRDYDPAVQFGGVILNRLGSDNHEHMIRTAMKKLGVPVLGAIRRDERMQSPERHLGLTPVTEIDPTEAIATIRDAVKVMVNLQALTELAQSAPDLSIETVEAVESVEKRARIGIAMDEAFSFYYPASLAALEAEGAELHYFSPLQDKELPDVDGVFFGGGFPEMFLSKLGNNVSMRDSIRKASQEGMPIYAECGGLMYMTEAVTDFEGNTYPMVGIVPATCEMQQTLQRVGYVSATMLEPNILGSVKDSLRGHEFHFSTMTPTRSPFPWAFELVGGRKPKAYQGGYAHKNILASYLHINFSGSEVAAKRFVDSCEAYSQRKV